MKFVIMQMLSWLFLHGLLHLGGPVPRDIYQRIKKLEDKILELEGLSPEYFQSVVSNFLASLFC